MENESQKRNMYNILNTRFTIVRNVGVVGISLNDICVYRYNRRKKKKSIYNIFYSIRTNTSDVTLPNFSGRTQ